MPFVAGQQKIPGSGKKKGSKNKISASVADAIKNAFEKVGGEDYLVMVAKENPNAFLALLGKLVAKQVNIGGQEDNELTIRIRGYQGDGD